MVDLPAHRNEHTGDAVLDRIQANVRDLITYVRNLAWVANRSYIALLVDTTIGIAAYATLLTTRITTSRATSYLLITFSASAVHITNIATIYFQIVVDGVVVKGTYGTYQVVPTAFPFSMIVRTPVRAGEHRVELQWKTDNTSARINAKSINEEHAHLLVEELPT